MIDIFDTTLRDGEQSPGVTFLPDEKLQIALGLEDLGVATIEAGFPAASPGDLQAVRLVSREIQSATVCALARAEEGDIEAAWGAIQDARFPRIHVFLSTSDIHIKEQLASDRKSVLEKARRSVALAHQTGAEVQFSPMDATRADRDFTVEVCQAAVEEGAQIINIPDTVGYALPSEYGELIQFFVQELSGTKIAVHTHNDLGLAVANALAGVLAGAKQVECSINGIGERAGNAATEEIIMLLQTRLPQIETGCQSEKIWDLSRIVSRSSGYPIPRNKAIVGRNAFAHESGIHQDGVLKDPRTYEIMDPRTIGRVSNELVLGKHSGRHAFHEALEQFGLRFDKKEEEEAFRVFKKLADQKQNVSEDDLRALFAQKRKSDWEIVSFRVETSSGSSPKACVSLRTPSGSLVEKESTGDGPVDALCKALGRAAGGGISMSDYQVAAIEGGSEAFGQVSVSLLRGSHEVTAQATGPDIVAASAEAFLRALEKL